jgi:hypothetical protein
MTLRIVALVLILCSAKLCSGKEFVNASSSPEDDLWSEWLLHRRHADDPEYGRAIERVIEGYADRVLDHARLDSGMTLLDVGTGDGLIAFRAIERIGPTLRVLMTDISEPILRHAEHGAFERKVHGQCTFLRCCADRLKGVADAAVDVVTTRAVLASASAPTHAGGGPLGIDYELKYDDAGIWKRSDQLDLEYAVVGTTGIGALWLGNEHALGHAFWAGHRCRSDLNDRSAGAQICFRSRPTLPG